MQPRNRPFLYMPVLLFKVAERSALRFLAEDVRPKVLPLLELVPPAEKFDDDEEPIPPLPMDLYLKACAKQLRDCWGGTVQVAVDTLYLEPLVGSELGGKSAMEFFFEELHFLGVQGIPVITTDTERAQLLAAKKIAARDHCGVCLRIRTWSWNDTSIDVSFTNDIAKLLATLKLPAKAIDVIFDAKDVDDKTSKVEKHTTRKLLEHLPRPKAWRSLVFTSCAFPKSLSKLDEHQIHTIPRLDWNLWRELVDEGGVMGRLLYGDYGINFPAQAAVTGSVSTNTVATIRYTSEQEWICPKGTYIGDLVVGQQLRRSGAGNGQFRELARRLIHHPKFEGEGFSHGDDDIIDIERGHKNPGNPQVWRGIGANHHITFVVRQLEGPVAS